MTPPFFTDAILSSFEVYHTCEGRDAKAMDVRGEPELLEVLNEKVAPLLEELEAYKNAQDDGAIREIRLREENERQALRISALEEALRDIINCLEQNEDQDTVAIDKARAALLANASPSDDGEGKK